MSAIYFAETKDPDPGKYGGPPRRYDSTEVYDRKGMRLFLDGKPFPGEQRAERPLVFIVDGARVDSATFARIQPESIKALEIIKGKAVAHLYGPDAEPGTIVVRTKGK